MSYEKSLPIIGGSLAHRNRALAQRASEENVRNAIESRDDKVYNNEKRCRSLEDLRHEKMQITHPIHRQLCAPLELPRNGNNNADLRQFFLTKYRVSSLGV